MIPYTMAAAIDIIYQKQKSSHFLQLHKSFKRKIKNTKESKISMLNVKLFNPITKATYRKKTKKIRKTKLTKNDWKGKIVLGDYNESKR